MLLNVLPKKIKNTLNFHSIGKMKLINHLLYWVFLYLKELYICAKSGVKQYQLIQFP